MKRYYHYKPASSEHDYYHRDKNCCSNRCQPKARSKIMGVCAGVARQFDWDVTGVRVVAVLGLIFMTGPTILAYIIAGALFY